MNNDIILCQPDDKKGCAICCGLFNHQNISKKSLTTFLEQAPERCNSITEPEILDYDASLPKRDGTTHICPYQGFLKVGKPGCLFHPSHIKKDLRDRSLYGRMICDNFFCPAHKILTEDEKKILINEIDDWYLYSIAIIDPLYFKSLLNDYKNMGDENAARDFLIECLKSHGEKLHQKEGPLFHYSISEYRISQKSES